MFNRLKIASKLLIGFGTLLLLLVGIASLSSIGSLRSRESIDDLARFKGNQVRDEIVDKHILEGRMHMWMALALGEDEHWKQSDEALKVAGKEIEELAENTTNAGRRAKAQQLGRLFESYREVASRMRSLHGRNEALNMPEAKTVLADTVKKSAEVASFSEELAEQYGSAAALSEASAKDTASLIVALAAGAGIASLLAGSALSFFIIRSIRQPIVNLTDIMAAVAKGDFTVSIPNTTEANEIGAMARSVSVFKENGVERLRLEKEAAANRATAEAERNRTEAGLRQTEAEQTAVVTTLADSLVKIAKGDLTARIETEFKGQYQQIKTDFNAAIAKLDETIQGVTGSARAILSGTQEISTASDDLSRRTEQQAASLEETAASLDEITATVNKTAEGAQHARDVVSAATADAEKSGIVVRNAIKAMNGIETSSKQIGQIIGVIDEIAFQTNLLALNAGVEAARAGDAGRGFAVVASEVRALAQRSAEAAKQIKSLISTSTVQVDQGVHMVEETGKALERIVAQVAEINDVVSTIAASAQEQATGLHQVNTAVNQMDQVTQQNAAMVEESTAAAHTLGRETEELGRLIGRFRTGESAAVTSLRRAPTKPAPATLPALKTVSTRGASAAVRKVATAAAAESWEEF
jgi:methyl-accepting chemotaxis protein